MKKYFNSVALSLTILLYQSLTLAQNASTAESSVTDNLSFQISIVTYGHVFIELHWPSTDGNREFRLILPPSFTLATTTGTGLSHVSVQNSNDQFVPMNSNDTEMWNQIIEKISLSDNPSKFVAMAALNNLILLPKGTTQLDRPLPKSDLCTEAQSHHWAYGTYNGDAKIKLVLTPIGDIQVPDQEGNIVRSECYGECGSKCKKAYRCWELGGGKLVSITIYVIVLQDNNMDLANLNSFQLRK